MADTLELEIVTPDHLVAREQVDSVQIPGKAGELGVLPGHAPLITELAIGEIRYVHGGQTTRLAAAWGFAEVLPEKVTILAETAERAEEINVQRAQEAKARAEQAMQRAAADLDYDATLSALRRAEVRLEVAGQAGQSASH
jgi:F-type H+-transporting ATPase subunit epsilon